MAIIDFFDRGWRINPKATAYIQDDRHYSFDEVGEPSCRIAQRTARRRLRPEAKGAVWASNDVTAWSCTLGLWRAGTVLDSGRRAQSGGREPLRARRVRLRGVVLPDTSSRPWSPACIRELPNVKAWICIDGEAPEVPGARSLQAWVADHPATRPNVDVDLDDVVVLSATGGTTGSPKGVMNTHRSTQTFCAHFMIELPLRGGRAAGQPGRGADHPYGRPALAALHRARRHRGSADQAGSGAPAASDTDPSSHGILSAADRDLPAAGHSGPQHESGLLVAQVLPVRGGTHVGRKAQAGHRHVRPGDDGRLWPDRGTDVDFLPDAW